MYIRFYCIIYENIVITFKSINGNLMINDFFKESYLNIELLDMFLLLKLVYSLLSECFLVGIGLV